MCALTLVVVVSSLPSVRVLLLLRSSAVGEGSEGATVVVVVEDGEEDEVEVSIGPFLLWCCRKYGSLAPRSRDDLVLRRPFRRSMSVEPNELPEEALGESCGSEGRGSRGGLEGRSSAREAEIEERVLGVVGAVEADGPGVLIGLGDFTGSIAEGESVA